MTTDPLFSEGHGFTREKMAFLLNLPEIKKQIPSFRQTDGECVHETVFVEEDSYCNFYNARVNLEDCNDCPNFKKAVLPEPEPEPQVPDDEVTKEIMVEHPDFLEIT